MIFIIYRAMDEMKIAYHDSSMIIIDVNDGNITLPWIDSSTSTETYWGIGSRTGLFIAMDMSLSYSKFYENNSFNNTNLENVPSTSPMSLQTENNQEKMGESNESNESNNNGEESIKDKVQTILQTCEVI